MIPAITKGYADVSGRQIHYRSCGSGSSILLCLAPAPFSGLAFTNILPLLADGRQVITPDYPGYGGSDPFGKNPSIADYAKAILGFIEAMSTREPIDLFGFHSGCLVAVEMALQRSAPIGQIVLVDVPAFKPEERRDYRQRLAEGAAPGEELKSLAPQWERAVNARRKSQPFEQRLALFAELVRSGHAIDAMFEAAFDYDVENRFAALDHPVTIIATNSSLARPSQRAAELLPKASLIERQDIAGSVLDAQAEATASAIQNILKDA